MTYNVNEEGPLGYLTAAETDELLSVVKEYTEALRLRLERLDKTKIWAALSVSLTIFLIIVTAIYLEIGFPEKLSDRQANGTLTLLTSIAGAVLGSTISIMVYARLRRTTDDVRRAAAILKSLVQRASQMKERSVFRFQQQIYVDIRLAEAEALLEQVQRARMGAASLLLRW